ncbi:MAG TPA: thiamine pyrophosphate-binding protein, partial [Blastocatellia bacterium]|nr:thiamine pyrophosphate-binding protein [Blastocatellia bacterium]
MRDLVMSYLSKNLSRRGFLRKMTASGFSAVAAKSVLESLNRLDSTASASSAPADDFKVVRGTGGEILVEQLRAAGVEFIVAGNSSHLRGVYDALVDRKDMQLIMTVEEGQAVAIASGYAMASGKLGVVAVSVAGVPHCASNMYNATQARLPVLVASDMVPLIYEDREGIYEGRNLIGAGDSNAKWNWYVSDPGVIPDITRRAIKVAVNPPGGPVLITYPEDTLVNEASATIIPQERFNIPAALKPPTEAVEAAAKMLIEAKSPAMYAGPEAWTSGARRECVELAELLGIPAMRVLNDSWVDCFPTAHPLYINAEHTPTTRFPQNADVLLVLGHFMPRPGRARTIHITTERNEINKAHPTDLPIAADPRIALRDIIAAIKSMATKERLAAIAGPRAESIRSFNRKMDESLKAVAKSEWDHAPISWPRLALELNEVLDPDAIIVDEL